MAGGGVKIQNIPEASSFGNSDSVLGVVNGEAALIPYSLVGGSSGSSGTSGSSGLTLWAPYTTSNDYTIITSDAHKIIIASNPTTAIVITVPISSTENFQIGDEVRVIRGDSASVTISGEMGVTLLSPGGLLSISSQNSMVTLIKIDTDTWSVTGSLS